MATRVRRVVDPGCGRADTRRRVTFPLVNHVPCPLGRGGDTSGNGTVRAGCRWSRLTGSRPLPGRLPTTPPGPDAVRSRCRRRPGPSRRAGRRRRRSAPGPPVRPLPEGGQGVLDVLDVVERHRSGHPLVVAARHEADFVAVDGEPDVVRRLDVGSGAEHRGEERLRRLEVVHGVEHGGDLHGHGGSSCHVSPPSWVTTYDAGTSESVTLGHEPTPADRRGDDRPHLRGVARRTPGMVGVDLLRPPRGS